MNDARAMIDRLGLAPHPEGGWYRETWRAETSEETRAGGTSILFLLEAGMRSHWHRVDATELWLFHAGTPLTLSISHDAPIVRHLMGSDPLTGHVQQAIVPEHGWQAAEAGEGWALVGCVVVPGFDFAGFEMAPAGWSPGD
jgi:predicted cupin superfamily sugar epimerase